MAIKRSQGLSPSLIDPPKLKKAKMGDSTWDYQGTEAEEDSGWTKVEKRKQKKVKKSEFKADVCVLLFLYLHVEADCRLWSSPEIILCNVVHPISFYVSQRGDHQEEARYCN